FGPRPLESNGCGDRGRARNRGALADWRCPAVKSVLPSTADVPARCLLVPRPDDLNDPPDDENGPQAGEARAPVLPAQRNLAAHASADKDQSDDDVPHG